MNRRAALRVSGMRSGGLWRRGRRGQIDVSDGVNSQLLFIAVKPDHLLVEIRRARKIAFGFAILGFGPKRGGEGRRVENNARDKLLKAVRESVAKFPDKIFDQARRRADSGDLDGAAESYILYLNSTLAAPNSKREQAGAFSSNSLTSSGH